jgi:ATP-dependent exoDNAse (exonuclease V) beta subunit
MIPDVLQKINQHEHDSHITFDEGPHIYTIDGDSSFTSCTTYIHSHFSHFDADGMIDKILKSNKINDPHYKYYGMTREDIKQMWSGNEASLLGTALHYDIECFYNGWEVNNDSIEYQYFLKFAEEYKHLKAYRTEWMVFHKELKIAGSIDMVFQDETDGEFWIYDWKRSKEISTESYGGKMALTPCISHLPDVNFYHYSLQLNIYRAILEEKYGKKIKGMCLVRLHPNNYFQTYERIEVPFMREEVDNLFRERLEQVQQQQQTKTI